MTSPCSRRRGNLWQYRVTTSRTVRLGSTVAAIGFSNMACKASPSNVLPVHDLGVRKGFQAPFTRASLGRGPGFVTWNSATLFLGPAFLVGRKPHTREAPSLLLQALRARFIARLEARADEEGPRDRNGKAHPRPSSINGHLQTAIAAPCRRVNLRAWTTALPASETRAIVAAG